MWSISLWIAGAKSEYCIYICIPARTVPPSPLHSISQIQGEFQNYWLYARTQPKKWAYLLISEPVNFCQGLRAKHLKLYLSIEGYFQQIEKPYFYERTGWSLYAQSSFQMKISDWFPSLQTRVKIKENKENSDIYFSCLTKLKDCLCSLKWTTELFDFIFLLTKQAQ